MDSLANKYGDQDFFRRNLFFKPCDHTERVYSFDTKDFFMFHGYTVVKY